MKSSCARKLGLSATFAALLASQSPVWSQDSLGYGTQPIDLSELAAAHRHRSRNLTRPRDAGTESGLESISLVEDETPDLDEKIAGCLPNWRTTPQSARIVTFAQTRAKCRKSTQNLLTQYLGLAKEERCNILKPSFLSKRENSNYRTVVVDYVKSCAVRWTGHNDNSLTEANRATIAASVGVISIPSTAQFKNCYDGSNTCVGLLLGRKVITARHCIIIEDENSETFQVVDDPDLEFTAINGEKYRLSLSGALSEQAQRRELDFTADEPHRDWIILDAEPLRPSRKAFRRVEIRGDLAKAGRNLLLVSYNPYMRAAHLVAANNRNDAGDLVQPAFSIEKTPQCSILQTDGRVLFHGCQTERTMSGSPLLTIESGRVVLLGVHNGSISVLKNRLFPGRSDKRERCFKHLQGLYPNYGIRLPDAVYQHLDRQDARHTTLR